MSTKLSDFLGGSFQGATGKVINKVVLNAVSANTAYTLAYTDLQAMLVYTANTAGVTTTITIPTNSSVNFAAGDTIHFMQGGSQQVKIQGDTGVTLNVRSGFTANTAVQWSLCSVTQVSTNNWVIYGDLA